MPRFQGATYFTMKGGLNTEASPLNIPASDATSIENVDIDIDGSITRRRAIDFIGASSDGVLYQDSPITDYDGDIEVPSFKQFNPINSNGTIAKHVVMHLGDEFRFYGYSSPEELKEIESPQQVIATGFDTDQSLYSTIFLPERQNLFVVNNKHPYGYFAFDNTTNAFSWNRLTPQYRDNSDGATSVKTNILSGNNGFSCGCMSGSRSWLSGANGKPNTVYFSQTMVDDSAYEKFYQEADPFDVSDNLLVDTDGGSIQITGAEKILSIAPLGSGVIVFAVNGVWSIAGQDGFRPTSYSINKISDVGLIGADGWCAVEQQLVFFSRSDVHTILLGTSIDTPEVKPIGNKIVNFYNSIPLYNLESGKAIYSPDKKKVYFFTNFTEYDWQTSSNPYNASTASKDVLVFDVRLAAWSKYTLGEDSALDKVSIADAAVLDGGRIKSVNVTDGGVLVTDGGVGVTAQSSTTSNASLVTNLILMKKTGTTWKVSFGAMDSDGLTDFSQSDDGDSVDNPSHITMAHQLFKDVGHKKFAPYLIPLFKRIESGTLVAGVDITQGSCMYRIDWNWSTNANSTKFGELRQAYFPYKYTTARFDGGDQGTAIVSSKLKVRGRGDVLRIHFESEDDKDFKLYGWQLMIHAKKGI